MKNTKNNKKLRPFKRLSFGQKFFFQGLRTVICRKLRYVRIRNRPINFGVNAAVLEHPIKHFIGHGQYIPPDEIVIAA